MRQRKFNRLRFAPSPNGYLHLGHAYSALLNWRVALCEGAEFVLRIEDIDIGRSRPEFVTAIFQDLTWLGLKWPSPVLHQSKRFNIYQSKLAHLQARDLIYPSFLSRKQIRDFVDDFEVSGQVWPRDPDGAPIYPDLCKNLSYTDRNARIMSGEPYSWRLDMDKAIELIGTEVTWTEYDLDLNAKVEKASLLSWGDVVLARKDVPTSYHLSVVLDDAFQEIDFVIRGQDIYHSTIIHRALQKLLDLPEPCYLHHDLILDDKQQKLSKSNQSKSVKELREKDGLKKSELMTMFGFR